MQKISESSDYLLYKFSTTEGLAVRVVSKKSKHSSDHYHIKVTSNGSRLKIKLTEDLLPPLVEAFKLHGPTLAFDNFGDDVKLEQDCGSSLIKKIRHTETVQESAYTSTGSKLDYHWPIFKKLADTGYGSIIRATLTLHQVCSSRCAFCSTINRSKSDSITLDEAIRFVDALYHEQADYNSSNFAAYNSEYLRLTGSPIRLRSVILSGGGQPNLWPHFSELVEYLASLDLDIGLITNGFPQNISEKIYKHFKWIRLSITPSEASPHYIDGKFENQYIPQTLLDGDTTVGCSYVYGPWSDNSIYTRLDKFAVKNNFSYVRLLCDCNLPRNKQLQSHQELADKLYNDGLIDVSGNPLSRVFHQLKYHMESAEAEHIWDNGTCFLQSYNVFWDTSGHDNDGYSYCYPCDSVTVLAEEDKENAQLPERGFNSQRWGTVPNTQVHRLFTERWQPFFDPRENCTACLFHRNNRKVKSLLDAFSSNANFKPQTSNNAIPHVNFP